jgi:hypothetical protein
MTHKRALPCERQITAPGGSPPRRGMPPLRATQTAAAGEAGHRGRAKQAPGQDRRGREALATSLRFSRQQTQR